MGINSAQSLDHFIAQSPWSVTEFRKRRLLRTLRALKAKKIIVVIDETGERKKGKKTDYVSRQYLGSIGKIERGIVTVNAYGIYEQITFPLIFKIFKPKGTLKAGDQLKTKIQLASEIITELIDFGFKIDRVLADSLYGESRSFISILEQHQLTWIVAVRSNHGVWMPSSQTVRANKWHQFERSFSDQTSEKRSIREIILHQQWNPQRGWKNTLNNLRLIIQPTILLWLITPWLDIFPNPHLRLGFHQLIQVMNQFQS